jgi:hypothetical protein
VVAARNNRTPGNAPYFEHPDLAILRACVPDAHDLLVPETAEDAR